MGRTYEPKVKMHTDLTIEKAIEEVARGATVAPTAKKYHVTTSLLRWRVWEKSRLDDKGETGNFSI